jgi:hypothetical protein
MDYKALEGMTVVELREEAKKHDIKSTTGMKKDGLVAAIADKLGLEAPAPKPKKTKKTPGVPLDKAGLKAKIARLKEERDKARSEKDRKQLVSLRKRIHALKRQMRKIA